MDKHPLDEAVRGLPAGTLIDDRYKVVRLITQGEGGILHEVEHTRTGRRLALKSRRDGDGQARIEGEARAASLMKNPHAVKVTDMGFWAGTGPYLVMDLVEGRSLRALLGEKEQLPISVTVNIALQVCEYLAEVHGRRLVHGALKPECILLEPSPLLDQHDVKIMDLGARAEAHPDRSSFAPKVGALGYESPEQLGRADDVDARADIYALGIVLYECLAGCRPREGRTAEELLHVISTGQPPELRQYRTDAPAAVCSITMRALSARREERPSSVYEIAAALLPHGDAAFGRWLQIEERRPDPLPLPPEQTMRMVVDTSPVDDGWAPAQDLRRSRDGETTEPDPPRHDSEPTTTSWLNAAAAPLEEDTASEDVDAETLAEDEPPTGEWNNRAVRELGEQASPANEPPRREGARRASWVDDGMRRAARQVDAFEVTVLSPVAVNRPGVAFGRQLVRDTPTEMFLKSDQDVIDRSTSPSVVPGHAPEPRFGPPPPFATTPLPGHGAEPRLSLATQDPLPAIPHAAMPGLTSDVRATTMRLADPRLQEGPRPIEKPGWQRPLDRALVVVGDAIERRVVALGRMSIAARLGLAFLAMVVLALIGAGAVYLVLG